MGEYKYINQQIYAKNYYFIYPKYYFFTPQEKSFTPNYWQMPQFLQVYANPIFLCTVKLKNHIGL